jgi:hypothetical protein
MGCFLTGDCNLDISTRMALNGVRDKICKLITETEMRISIKTEKIACTEVLH